MPAGTPRVGGARNATPRVGGARNATPRAGGARNATPRAGGARNATPRAGGAGNAAPRPSGAAADATDAVFAALSDGTRRSLYANLGERGEATATDLARDLPVTRQAVQKHLGTLASAGLVATRRAGREVLYRPTPAPMSEALAWMAEVGAQWDDRLAALERQLAGRAPHQPIG